VVVVGPRGFGLNVVGLLRTDCLGPGICAGSEDDESDYSLRHYHRDHHHHLEVLGGFHHYQEEVFPPRYQCQEDHCLLEDWHTPVEVIQVVLEIRMFCQMVGWDCTVASW